MIKKFAITLTLALILMAAIVTIPSLAQQANGDKQQPVPAGASPAAEAGRSQPMPQAPGLNVSANATGTDHRAFNGTLNKSYFANHDFRGDLPANDSGLDLNFTGMPPALDVTNATNQTPGQWTNEFQFRRLARFNGTGNGTARINETAIAEQLAQVNETLASIQSTIDATNASTTTPEEQNAILDSLKSVADQLAGIMRSLGWH